MMSMVPEEGSLTPSEIQPNKSPTPITAGSGGVVPSGEQPTPTPRKRAVETLNNIKKSQKKRNHGNCIESAESY